MPPSPPQPPLLPPPQLSCVPMEISGCLRYGPYSDDLSVAVVWNQNIDLKFSWPYVILLNMLGITYTPAFVVLESILYAYIMNF